MSKNKPTSWWDDDETVTTSRPAQNWWDDDEPAAAGNGAGMGSVNPMVAMGQQAQDEYARAGSPALPPTATIKPPPVQDPLMPKGGWSAEQQAQQAVRAADTSDPFRTSGAKPAPTPAQPQNWNDQIASWISDNITPVAQKAGESVGAMVLGQRPGGEAVADMGKSVGGGLSEWGATAFRDPVDAANQAIETLDPAHQFAYAYNDANDATKAAASGDWEKVGKELKDLSLSGSFAAMSVLPGNMTYNGLKAATAKAGPSIASQVFKPGPTAADRAADILIKKMKADGLTLDDLRTVQRSLANRGDSGVYETFSELGGLSEKSSGANLRGLAMALGSIPGEAQEAILARVAQNAEQLPKRTSRAASRATGQDAKATAGTLDELERRLREESTPLYDAFYNSPVEASVYDAEISPIIGTDQGKRAAGSALRNLRTQAASLQAAVASGRADLAPALNRTKASIDSLSGKSASFEPDLENGFYTSGVSRDGSIEGVKHKASYSPNGGVGIQTNYADGRVTNDYLTKDGSWGNTRDLSYTNAESLQDVWHPKSDAAKQEVIDLLNRQKSLTVSAADDVEYKALEARLKQIVETDQAGTYAPQAKTARLTPEALDHVKRAFDDQIEAAGHGSYTASNLRSAKRNFAESVSRATGGTYGDALGFYEGGKRLEEAFDIGLNALKQPTWQLERSMNAGMRGSPFSAGEVEAIAMGVARHIEDLIETNDQAALTKLLKGKALKNLSTALGDPKAAAKFEQSIQRLAANREWGRRVSGGSDTAMRLAAIDDASRLEEDPITRALDRAKTSSAPPTLFGAAWDAVGKPIAGAAQDAYRRLKYPGIRDEEVNAALAPMMGNAMTKGNLDQVTATIEARLAAKNPKLLPPLPNGGPPPVSGPKGPKSLPPAKAASPPSPPVKAGFGGTQTNMPPELGGAMIGGAAGYAAAPEDQKGAGLAMGALGGAGLVKGARMYARGVNDSARVTERARDAAMEAQRNTPVPPMSRDRQLIMKAANPGSMTGEEVADYIDYLHRKGRSPREAAEALGERVHKSASDEDIIDYLNAAAGRKIYSPKPKLEHDQAQYIRDREAGRLTFNGGASPEAAGAIGGGAAGYALAPDQNGDGVVDAQERAAGGLGGFASGIAGAKLLRSGANGLRQIEGPPKPRGPDQATFGGVNAKTADKKLLGIAQQMEKAGAGRDQIYRETGWFKGVDGKWRFEIDDSQSKLGDKALEEFWNNKGTSGRSAGILHHKPLYEAYPEMRENTTALREQFPSGGSWDRQEKIIYADGSTPSEGRSVILHEGQHAVQDAEGFASGGSLNTFTQQKEAELARDALFWRREVAAKRKEMPQADWIAVENAVVHDYQKNDMMDWLPSREARDLANDRLGNPDAQLDELVKVYGLDQSVSTKSPREMYRRLAGETEARNVQTRRDFTPEQRRARPPWTTQDVPDDQQIVRYGAGQANSEPPTKPLRLYTGANKRYDSFDNYPLDGAGGAIFATKNEKMASGYGKARPIDVSGKVLDGDSAEAAELAREFWGKRGAPEGVSLREWPNAVYLKPAVDKDFREFLKSKGYATYLKPPTQTGADAHSYVILDPKAVKYADAPKPTQQGFGGSPGKPGGKGPPANALKDSGMPGPISPRVIEDATKAAGRLAPEARNKLRANAFSDDPAPAMQASGFDPNLFSFAQDARTPAPGKVQNAFARLTGQPTANSLERGLQKSIESVAGQRGRSALRVGNEDVPDLPFGMRMAMGERNATRKEQALARRAYTRAEKADKLDADKVKRVVSAEREARVAQEILDQARLDAFSAEDVGAIVREQMDAIAKAMNREPPSTLGLPTKGQRVSDALDDVVFGAPPKGARARPKAKDTTYSASEADDAAKLLFSKEYARVWDDIVSGRTPVESIKPGSKEHLVLTVAAVGGIGALGVTSALLADRSGPMQEPHYPKPEDPRVHFDWTKQRTNRRFVENLQTRFNQIDRRYQLREDGIWSEGGDTDKVIRFWQDTNGFAPDGNLTEDQVALIEEQAIEALRAEPVGGRSGQPKRPAPRNALAPAQ